MQNNEDFDEELTEIIEHLLEVGALEILGYDSVSDNFTYKVTEKCKEIYPELYQTHYEMIGEVAQGLWMRDIIDIIFTEGQTVVGVTAEQFDYIKENILEFNEEERMFLESILSYYENKNGVE
jgi:hypothetical protein